MATRREALARVKTNDVIYGVTKSGQQKLLLVREVERSRIRTRHVTTGENIDFDRDGQSLPEGRKETCRITSTVSLAQRDYNTIIGLDHKLRTAKALTDLRLSKAEIALLLTVHDFFDAHSLPGD